MDNDNISHKSEKLETPPEGSPGLTDDSLYRALASTQRRRALYILLVEEETRIEKIATVLAGWDATETGTMATPKDRKEILIQFRHVHLPQLVEAGLVSTEEDCSKVRMCQLDTAVIDLICQSVESECTPV